MIRCISMLLLLCTLAACKQGLVYTSAPRDLRPIENGPQDRSTWQRVSDVKFINGGFIESDLEFLTFKGETLTIGTCTDKEEVCAYLEARPSPDGKWIAYSKAQGDYLKVVNGATVINSITQAFIYLYNTRTGESHRIPGQKLGHIYRMPDWLSNKKLVVSTNAEGVYPIKDQFGHHRGLDDKGRGRWGANAYGVSQAYGYGPSGMAMQLWTMNIDGTDQRNITPEETMAIRPTVLKYSKYAGWIVYSCWNSQEDKAFDAPRHSNNPGTNVNKYWLCMIDGNGADKTVLLGAHKHLDLEKLALLPEGTTGGERRHSLLALRSVVELQDGRICVVSYYRGNHMGGGPIVCFDIDDHRVEGVYYASNFVGALSQSDRPGSGRFTPSSLELITPFANGQDQRPHVDKHDRPTGKSGFAFALPNNGMGITRARGYCYPIFYDLRPHSDDLGGEPLCDLGIYRVLKTPVTDPFDPDQLEPIIDSPTDHEWDAALVFPTDEPPAPPPLDPDAGCFLQVVDGRASELVPPDPYDWRKLWSHTAHQGNAIKAHDPNYLAKNNESLAIYGMELWRTTYPDKAFKEASNKHGYQRKWLIGTAPFQDDGSLRVEVPCEQPLQMSGNNSDGANIAHDAMLHSLRRGETRTCHGCHDGHSEERARELGARAEARFANTLAAKAPASQLTGGREVRWPDVQPIITERCGSCHEGFQNDALLRSRVADDFEQLDFAWLPRHPTHNGDYRLPRPYFSGLVARFPGWSRLYWACMGERLDGYTNAEYSNDIDFPEDHVAAGSDEECRAIAAWINQGVSE